MHPLLRSGLWTLGVSYGVTLTTALVLGGLSGFYGVGVGWGISMIPVVGPFIGGIYVLSKFIAQGSIWALLGVSLMFVYGVAQLVGLGIVIAGLAQPSPASKKKKLSWVLSPYATPSSQGVLFSAQF